MAALFGVQRPAITRHLKNIFVSNELEEKSVCSFNEYNILSGKGRVSHQLAVEKAALEYDKFNKVQKIKSDFDRELKKLFISKKRP